MWDMNEEAARHHHPLSPRFSSPPRRPLSRRLRRNSLYSREVPAPGCDSAFTTLTMRYHPCPVHGPLTSPRPHPDNSNPLHPPTGLAQFPGPLDSPPLSNSAATPPPRPKAHRRHARRPSNLRPDWKRTLPARACSVFYSSSKRTLSSTPPAPWVASLWASPSSFSTPSHPPPFKQRRSIPSSRPRQTLCTPTLAPSSR